MAAIQMKAIEAQNGPPRNSTWRKESLLARIWLSSDALQKSGIILVLALAAFLRLRELDLTAFGIDEGIASILAIQLTHYGMFPLVGVKTSLYFYNPPLLVFLLLPFNLISANPLLPLAAIALLGVVTVGIIYVIGRQYCGEQAALIAMLAAAVSPMAVLYSRGLWGHDFIPFLSTLLFLVMLRWAVEHNTRALFWIPLFILLAQQLHFSGVLLWINFILVLIIFRPPWRWKPLAVGLGLGVLPYVPYCIHLIKTHFIDLKIILHLIFSGADTLPSAKHYPFLTAFYFLSDGGHHDLMGENYDALLRMMPVYSPLRIAMGGILILLILWAAWRCACMSRLPEQKRSPRRARELTVLSVILIWIAVPILAFSLLRVAFVTPYLLLLFPAVFVLLGLGIQQVANAIAQRRRRWAWGLVCIFLAVWSIAQVAYLQTGNALLARATMSDKLFTCLRYQWEVAKFIDSKRAGKNCLVVQDIRKARTGIDFSYFYLFWRIEGDVRPFRDLEGFDTLFLIRDAKANLSTAYAKELERYHARDFGTARVYVIPRDRLSPYLARLFDLSNTPATKE
jgi:4-amino-4-deoxy-L-arabinose transferase-like glycosyltransferase